MGGYEKWGLAKKLKKIYSREARFAIAAKSIFDGCFFEQSFAGEPEFVDVRVISVIGWYFLKEAKHSLFPMQEQIF